MWKYPWYMSMPWLWEGYAGMPWQAHLEEPVMVAEKNPLYARLLLDDFASRDSELTAMMQYFYHSWVSEPEELKRMYREFAMDEAHHHDMTARAIVLLGGEPRYMDSRRREWRAGYIYYGRDICDRLRANLKGELKAIEQYRYHQRMINDPYIKTMLEHFIMDEHRHARRLEEMLAQYCYLEK